MLQASDQLAVPRRVIVQYGGLMVALAAAQVWRPMVAYPSSGRWLLLLWCGLLLGAHVLRRMLNDTARLSGAAGVAGVMLVAYAWGNWAARGFPFVGADSLSTLLLGIVVGFTAYGVMRAAACSGGMAHGIARLLLGAVAAGGVACGLHAMAQRLFIYDRMRAQLLADLAGAPPDALQLGLLHHFQLKRVASVWGDPNAMGAFLALATVAGGVLLLTAFRRRDGWLLGAVGAAAIPCALVGIWFSGSRGAMLDLVIAAGVAALFWWLRRRGDLRGETGGNRGRLGTAPVVFAVLCAAVVLTGGTSGPIGPMLQDEHASEAITAAVPAAAQTGWRAMLARSDTLRERGYYALVGLRIFGEAPLTGMGPGAVDLNFGRLKPAEARESKYLHNWVLQMMAEYGAAGLALFLWLLVAVGRAGAALMRRGRCEEAALAVMFVVMVCDGLYQLSFNQRELMMISGLLAGSVAALGAVPVGTNVLGRSRRLAFAGVPLLFAWMIHAGFPPLGAAVGRERAQAEIEESQLAAAEQTIVRTRRVAPRDPQLYMLEARIAAMRGDRAAAVRLTERAVQLQPKSASLRSSLGEALRATGAKDEALKSVARAVELYPTKAEYRDQYSRLLEEAGDRAGALREARLAVRYAYLFGDKYQARLSELEAAGP